MRNIYYIVFILIPLMIDHIPAKGQENETGGMGDLTIPNIIVMDANMHVNLADKMAEYESLFIFKASEKLYPKLGLRGEITQNATSLYSLVGLKFRIADATAIGVGIQVPITHEREYDT